jgi:hypothetical protein
MTTTRKINAIQTRNEQFADIDAKIERLIALRKDLARKTVGRSATDWSYTGRGGDLARLQDALAVALGDEG